MMECLICMCIVLIGFSEILLKYEEHTGGGDSQLHRENLEEI